MTPGLTGRAGTTTRPSPAGSDRRLIPPMAVGSALNPVSSSVIAVALVPIGVAFGAPPAETAGPVPALHLPTVVGRAVHRYGPRRLHLAATTLVGVVRLPLSVSAPAVSAPTGRREAVRGKLFIGSALRIAGCAPLLLLRAGSALWLPPAVATLLGVPRGFDRPGRAERPVPAGRSGAGRLRGRAAADLLLPRRAGRVRRHRGVLPAPRPHGRAARSGHVQARRLRVAAGDDPAGPLPRPARLRHPETPGKA